MEIQNEQFIRLVVYFHLHNILWKADILFGTSGRMLLLLLGLTEIILGVAYIEHFHKVPQCDYFAAADAKTLLSRPELM